MSRWLYNSNGEAVAFVSNDNVFDKNTKFIGNLEGNTIWNSSYVAEIIKDDRIAIRSMKPLGLKGLPRIPEIPSIPSVPGLKGTTLFPVGFDNF